MEKTEYRRFYLIFKRGFLFYAFFNIRLFFFLLTRKGPAILLANDLDTLAANLMVSRLRGWTLIYDSHEYFTEVPELIDRNFVRKFWIRMEKILVPRVDFAYTVNDTLAKMYSAKYGKKFAAVRNVPDRNTRLEDYRLPEIAENKKIILYQGAVNKDRGIETMIQLIPQFGDVIFIIAGDGDIINDLKEMVWKMNLTEKVFFTGRLDPYRLKSLSRQAHVGISLERKTNLNYYYALPNKLFDYIQAGIPVVCSSFPEMKKIVDGHKTGIVVNPDDEDEIVNAIGECLYDAKKRALWSANCEKAAGILNWENEQKLLISIYKEAGMKFAH